MEDTRVSVRQVVGSSPSCVYCNPDGWARKWNDGMDGAEKLAAELRNANPWGHVTLTTPPVLCDTHIDALALGSLERV